MYIYIHEYVLRLYKIFFMYIYESKKIRNATKKLLFNEKRKHFSITDF